MFPRVFVSGVYAAGSDLMNSKRMGLENWRIGREYGTWRFWCLGWIPR